MRKFIPKLKIRCTAGYVNNFVTPDCTTYVEISIENPSGSISVENKNVGPRSEHTFIIKDATPLGLKGDYHLTEEQATDIFLLSCSLLMQKYYLSRIQPVQMSSEVEYVSMPLEDSIHEKPSEDTIFCFAGQGSVHVSCRLSSKIKIDEIQLLQTVERLLRYNIFDLQSRTPNENNVIEAIKSYQEAFTTTGYSSCYLTLYPALEKAVNSNKKRSGDKFDIAASNLTGIQQNEFERLRIFYNRLKHQLRDNSTDLSVLREGQKDIQLLLRDLKEATDTAILARLG